MHFISAEGLHFSALVLIAMPQYTKCTLPAFAVMNYYVCSTASEFQSWLLWYSLPVLKGVLASSYYNHSAKFVAAVATLLQDNIPKQNLPLAKRLLKEFCKDISGLYGEL